MTLPLLISVPHGGLRVPEEVAPLCMLTGREIVEDGDEGAAAIYAIESEVEGFVSTDVARAIVDMNRAEEDFRKDGIVKTHTCWDVPIYREPLTEEQKRGLITAYWRPYHARLTELAPTGPVLGIDCHTMAAHGPPVGPDAGAPRPAACLSDADGTLPRPWFTALAACLEKTLERKVSLNDPFAGGYITRAHSRELPWVQLELSRAPFATHEEKRERILEAFGEWCRRHAPGGSR